MNNLFLTYSIRSIIWKTLWSFRVNYQIVLYYIFSCFPEIVLYLLHTSKFNRLHCSLIISALVLINSSKLRFVCSSILQVPNFANLNSTVDHGLFQRNEIKPQNSISFHFVQVSQLAIYLLPVPGVPLSILPFFCGQSTLHIQELIYQQFFVIDYFKS